MKVKFKIKTHAGTERIYPDDEISAILLEILRLGGPQRKTFSSQVMDKIKIVAQKMSFEIDIKRELKKTADELDENFGKLEIN